MLSSLHISMWFNRPFKGLLSWPILLNIYNVSFDVWCFCGWFFSSLTSDFLADCSASTQQSRILRSLMSLPKFTWKDIQLTVMDFVAGGVFSVTQTLTFFIHRVAVHKSVQANIFNALQKKKDCRDEQLAGDSYIKVFVLVAYVVIYQVDVISAHVAFPMYSSNSLYIYIYIFTL